MPSNIDALREAILALPYEDKAHLVDELMRSLVAEAPESVRQAQMAEVSRRREEFLSGQTKLIPGEQVEREIETLLNEISRVPPRGAR